MHHAAPRFPDQPDSLRMALTLLRASTAIGLVTCAVGGAHALDAVYAGPISALVALLGTLAVTGFLRREIARGNHSARNTLLVLSFVGIALCSPALLAELGHAPVIGLVWVLQISVRLFALGLLFVAPRGLSLAVAGAREAT